MLHLSLSLICALVLYLEWNFTTKFWWLIVLPRFLRNWWKMSTVPGFNVQQIQGGEVLRDHFLCHPGTRWDSTILMELWGPTSKVYIFFQGKIVTQYPSTTSSHQRKWAFATPMFHGSIHLFHEQSKMFGVEGDQINTDLKIREPWLWGDPPHRLTSYLENSPPLRDWIWFILVAGHKILRHPQKTHMTRGKSPFETKKKHRLKWLECSIVDIGFRGC